jgi:hypothetical protein
MINFIDLETKGFVVIKNFFPDSLISLLREDYQKQYQQSSWNKNKNYQTLSISSVDWKIENSIKSILDDITRNTNLTINCLIPGGAYFNNQLNNFKWHQDHEPFYSWQDMYNAINCWIPIIKDNSLQSGISIIPHDVFFEKYPDFFTRHIVGQGAKKFYKMDTGATIMFDDYHGSVSRLPFDLDDLSLSPELTVGDLLIIRQDVVHRTQDTICDRVALSIRCNNNNGVLTKSHFLKSCTTKERMMNNNIEWYDRFKKKFENADQILIKDMLEIIMQRTFVL